MIAELPNIVVVRLFYFLEKEAWKRGEKKDKFYKKELDRLNGCKDCQNKNCKWNSKVATSEIAHRGQRKIWL